MWLSDSGFLQMEGRRQRATGARAAPHGNGDSWTCPQPGPTIAISYLYTWRGKPAAAWPAEGNMVKKYLEKLAGRSLPFVGAVGGVVALTDTIAAQRGERAQSIFHAREELFFHTRRKGRGGEGLLFSYAMCRVARANSPSMSPIMTIWL